ncbi:adenine nucleotide alpha hydrolase [Chryseobacterium sp. SNU WT5]|uniref:adenine nucleotide alpha hydrolase n=1 Tax=Chryseobacterium sp. SNU WT5 TaxID=2594269 RepID=UPI001181323C|nr:adenine nucleotide alpha hydrolase [Chryseobacterium sp. SNU WT5]QDP84290.1 adenine nucleotide alpha hydrolase [Chryseobacterium sp. SNU WT5]
MKKAVFNWSGGKDSALALQKIIQENEYEVISLLTTFSKETLKSSMHNISLDILTKQAESIGIPLYTVFFAKELNNYDEKMREAVDHFKQQNVAHFIFGDIHLFDVKTYRESKLNPLGIEVLEPLWGKTSEEIMEDLLRSGIKTKIIITQADKLDSSFIGKDLDADLVRLFPSDIDICGEEGEYHTLAYEGGPFKKKVEFLISEANKISHEFKLDDGELKTFEYWQAEVTCIHNL